MTQPRPTHEVFRLKPSEPSYDKFVPATSSNVEPHIDQPVEQPHAPAVDTLDELRRDDQAYLESLASSQRHHALEQLEREKQEAEVFRRERVTVKRRVNVADQVRGRVHQPLVGSLGLPGMIRKKRVVNKSHTKNDGNTDRLLDDTKSDELQSRSERMDARVQGYRAKDVQPVELVSGYSSSSDDDDDDDDDEQNIRTSRVGVGEETKESDGAD